MGRIAWGLVVPGPRWVCSPSWERNFLPAQRERGGCPAPLGGFPRVEKWPKSDLCPSGFLGNGGPSLAEPPTLHVAGGEASPSFSALSLPPEAGFRAGWDAVGQPVPLEGMGSCPRISLPSEDALMGEGGLPTTSSHSFFYFSWFTLFFRGQRASRVHRGSQDPKACQESKETR